MLNAIIRFSLQNRLLVIAVAVFLVVLRRLASDAACRSTCSPTSTGRASSS